MQQLTRIVGRFPVVTLLLLLAFLFVAADGLRIIQYPPRTTHIFRQSDCLAYTKTYFRNDLPFFKPATYNLIGKEGRVVSEFPVLYYLSAKICKVVGYHLWVIRGVTFLCYIFGLLYLFGIARMWLRGFLLPAFVVVMLGASPFYFFYAVNFLPNVPAISFSLVGLYHWLRYKDRAKVLHLLAGTLFFALALLLKPTDGGLIPVAILGALLMTNGRREVNAATRLRLLGSFGVVSVVMVWWFLFVRAYNAENGNNINLQGIYPMWEMGRWEIYETFRFRLLDQGPKCFHSVPMLLLLLGFFGLFLMRWKKMDVLLRNFVLMLVAGAVVYGVLWFKAFMIHDYYQLIFAIPAVFLTISVLHYFQQHVLNTMSGVKVRIAQFVTAALMIAAIYYNQAMQLDRYSDANIGFDNIQQINEVEPYLRKIGVKPTDIVLSVPDGSPNISLVAYGNPGYSSDLFWKGNFSVPFCKEHGAKYMIVANGTAIHEPAYEPYTKKLIGRYKDIYIYDISD